MKRITASRLGEPTKPDRLCCHHMKKIYGIYRKKRDGESNIERIQLAFKTDRKSSGRLCRTVSSCPCRCNRIWGLTGRASSASVAFSFSRSRSTISTTSTSRFPWSQLVISYLNSKPKYYLQNVKGIWIEFTDWLRASICRARSFLLASWRRCCDQESKFGVRRKRRYSPVQSPLTPVVNCGPQCSTLARNSSVLNGPRPGTACIIIKKN